MYKNPPECVPLRAVNASLWSLAPMLMCCKGMKNVHFQVSPKLRAKRRKKKEKKKVVHSPFSALALQMLMKSVLSWAVNRSKMLWFGSICIPSWIERQPADRIKRYTSTPAKGSWQHCKKLSVGRNLTVRWRGRSIFSRYSSFPPFSLKKNFKWKNT